MINGSLSRPGVAKGGAGKGWRDKMSWYGESDADFLTVKQKDALAYARNNDAQASGGVLSGMAVFAALALPLVANAMCWLLHGHALMTF